MKTSKSIKRILIGAALFMLFTGLFTACPQKIKDKKISVDGISLDKNELTINVGESSKLSAAISPANASNKKITWTSDKPEIAEVDQNGNVTGKAEGNAVITATTEDGNKTATCTVKVEKGAILILSPDKKDIYIKAVTSSGSNITVIGCTQTELTSEVEQTLHATSNRVILKGDIKILYCSFNQLTNLYVQGLNDLEELYCSGNQLTSLDVQGLNNLKKLYCDENQLTSLDVDGLNNLKKLNCSENQLTSLNVHGLNNLKKLNCSKNQLTSLNVQGLNNLEELYCYRNQLTSLNVQGLNNLKNLYCSDNQLISLDVQGLNNLESLDCYKNQLTSLNVQGLNNLKNLYFGLNKLTKEVFRKLFDDLPARTAGDNARCILYAEITGITEGNYTGFTMEELKVIKDKNWNTYKVNSSGYLEEI